MQTAETNQTRFTQMSTKFDAENGGVLWTQFNQPGIVPCFTYKILHELAAHHSKIVKGVNPVQYSVLSSLTPDVFSLGGQLELFSQLITTEDRAGLLMYATACVNILYQRIQHFGRPLTTISLVQGKALGGGFEAALASDIIIAEKGSEMGLPEILFNLFPGMGAYSLLARRIGPVQAEIMILDGNMHSAEDLSDLGVVDVLAEKGEGEVAVAEFIKKQARRSNGFAAVQRARQRVNPITHQELMDITMIWVDAALKLQSRDLRMMEKLINSQNKNYLLKEESDGRRN